MNNILISKLPGAFKIVTGWWRPQPGRPARMKQSNAAILNTSTLLIALLLTATTAPAQKQKKQSADNLAPYRELVSLGKWYLHTPLQIRVQVTEKTTPAVREQDNMETEMLLFYGKNDFYMRVGEMEQIANDSFTVLVNDAAKMIRLFPNTATLSRNMEHIIPSLVPDAELEKLEQQYSIEIQNEEKGIRTMTVRSRHNVSGTDFSRETLTITYHSHSQQPVSYLRTMRSLVPVDSAIYRQMEADPAYAGRTVMSKTTKGDLFFIMKEKTTECRFVEVSHREQAPPALQQHRIVRTESGDYIPATGFGEYLVSKDF